jgi:hypothetical protein
VRNGPCARGMEGRGAPAGEGVRVRPLSGKERRGMGIAGGIYSPGGGGGGAVRGMVTNKGAAMRRGVPEKR